MAPPRFWHRLIGFRHVISGSLALTSLNHTCRNLVPAFPQRSPRLLLTTAACGGLRSTPYCRPRRTYLHLSYSYAPPCGPALLVTQCQEPTYRVATIRDYSITLSVRPSNQEADCPIQVRAAMCYVDRDNADHGQGCRPHPSGCVQQMNPSCRAQEIGSWFCRDLNIFPDGTALFTSM